AAIIRAFEAFAGTNDYGRGTAIMHIPDEIPNISERDIVRRNRVNNDELAKKRLHDLVTVLMVVGFVFAPAMAAGAIIGGALAAEHILARWQRGTLALDESLISDVISIVGAVASGAQIGAGLLVTKTREAFVIAAASGDMAAIEST